MSNLSGIAGRSYSFRAVIAQAFHDALNRRAIDGKAVDSDERSKDAERKPVDWLLTDSPDFRRVCEWALLEPKQVDQPKGDCKL